MQTGATLTKVKRSASEPLRDQILQRCRMMLMAGHVVPGQKLPLRPLAEEFDTSLMPVRDALNRLVADGALELSSSRTIRVPDMSDERLIELHEIRRSLEGLAAEYATPHISVSSIDRMQELIGEMAEALKVDDFDTYIARHFSFHFTLYAAAERETLLGLIDRLWLQVGPYFRQGIEQAKTACENPNVAHIKIVAGLKARDSTMVRTSVEYDVFSAVDFLRTGIWPKGQ